LTINDFVIIASCPECGGFFDRLFSSIPAGALCAEKFNLFLNISLIESV